MSAGDVLMHIRTAMVTTGDQFTRKAEGTLELQLPGQNSCHYIWSVWSQIFMESVAGFIFLALHPLIIQMWQCKWWLMIEYDRDFWIGWFPLSPNPVLWLSRGPLLFSERPLLIFSLFHWSEESNQDATSVSCWQEVTKYTIVHSYMHAGDCTQGL